MFQGPLERRTKHVEWGQTVDLYVIYLHNLSAPILWAFICDTYEDVAILHGYPRSMLDVPQDMELRELQGAQYEVVVQHPPLRIIGIGRVVIDSSGSLEVEA